MRKFILGSLVACVLFASTGCKKLLLYSEGHGVPYIVPGQKISTIVAYPSSVNGVDSIAISYNAAGNPVSAFHLVPTGDPYDYSNFLMYYDASGRLTDLVALFGTSLPDSSDNSVVCWNRYFYNSAGDIILDSVINFPLVLHGKPYIGQHGIPKICTFGYDAQHRVTYFANAFVGAPDSTVHTYSYDSSGNLAGVGHDNKINFNRTNKIWQFLNLDYSVNNPASATYTYNSYGLPVTFEGSKTFIGVSSAASLATITSGSIFYTAN